MPKWIKFFKKSSFIYLSSLSSIHYYKKIIYHAIDKDLTLIISNDININITELEVLCSLVGWVKRPPQKVKKAINTSLLNLTLSLHHRSQYKLIGFVRAISDNAFNATIWDMVIHPEYQSQGLGTILMKTIIQELRYLEIDTITLFADAKSIKFYNKLGFIPDPLNIKGMFWYPQ
uniref:GCN5-like N-acetyltransferase n=1 Tax=Stylonema alsidii TaxID=35155 RepID=UPI001FCD2C32|nr:GCN5-like N-acetyltransferase [Stylonema alsidii]UNJ15106.1 GCN5-like N-acetyltransferase [Stylonema alsidii]